MRTSHAFYHFPLHLTVYPRKPNRETIKLKKSNWHPPTNAAHFAKSLFTAEVVGLGWLKWTVPSLCFIDPKSGTINPDRARSRLSILPEMNENQNWNLRFKKNILKILMRRMPIKYFRVPWTGLPIPKIPIPLVWSNHHWSTRWHEGD